MRLKDNKYYIIYTYKIQSNTIITFTHATAKYWRRNSRASSKALVESSLQFMFLLSTEWTQKQFRKATSVARNSSQMSQGTH
jgi:hypothetical protein